MVEIKNIQDMYGGFDINQEADYLKDDGPKCCYTSMKWWLIICNVILIILGCVSVAMGIFVQTNPGFKWTAGSVGVGLICMGVFLIFIAILGCVAACKASKCAMGIYSTLLFIFFVAELAALIVAVTATNVAVKEVNDMWVNVSDKNKDGIGIYFGCCGVSAANKAEMATDANDVTCLPAEVGKETHWKASCQIYGSYIKEGKSTATSKLVFGTYTNMTYGTPPTDTPANTAGCAVGTVSTAASAVEGIPSACLATKHVNDDDRTKISRCKKDGSVGDRIAGCAYATLASIPACTSKAKLKYKTYMGPGNGYKSEKDTLFAPVAACYSKFEAWLTRNKTSIMVIIIILFLYHLFNLIFACLLCCGCCSGNKQGTGASDV